MAFDVPIEVHQHILDSVDIRSFNASRNLSKRWRNAAHDDVTLARQLQRLPIEPPIQLRDALPTNVAKLFRAAVTALMLDMHVKSVPDREPQSQSRLAEPKITFSADGRRAATLEDRQITLYDTTSREPAIISRQPLNDLRNAAGNGPWFKCAPTCNHELALSRDGGLLGIALERTIQIYDLSSEEDVWPIASYIPSAAGHYIAALFFEHNDSLLRIQLSNKGTVVYLGVPADKTADFEHWRTRGGLKHAFLDTSKITAKTSEVAVLPAKLAGVRLLNPMGSGWLFVAQEHGSKGSGYCLGHVENQVDATRLPITNQQVTILTTLAINHSNRGETWNELPRAQQGIQPHYAVSQDERFLALSEPSERLGGPSTKNKLFVYRLPNRSELQEQLTSSYKAREEAASASKNKILHTVSRLPLYVGDISGRVLKFSISKERQDNYILTAATASNQSSWALGPAF